MRSPQILKQLLSRTEGASAVEFGLMLPVLLTIVITISDVTSLIVGTGEMQTAVRAAVQYLMNGGTTISTAQSQGIAAWNNKPSDGSLTAAQACFCSGASHSCQTLCGDNTSPQIYYTVSANGTLGGNVIKQSKTVSETIRVK